MYYMPRERFSFMLVLYELFVNIHPELFSLVFAERGSESQQEIMIENIYWVNRSTQNSVVWKKYAIVTTNVDNYFHASVHLCYTTITINSSKYIENEMLCNVCCCFLCLIIFPLKNPFWNPIFLLFGQIIAVYFLW